MTDSFWKLSTGHMATGNEKDSFMASFELIPDGTQATALIKNFIINVNGETPVYQIIYKISDGDFAGREVRQNIKCFDHKPTVADKAINMLKRLYDLCSYQPAHQDAPGEPDLDKFKGRSIGIKISEWSMKKDDGSLSEGNYVSEIHPIQGWAPITGEKKVYHAPVESALTRHADTRDLNDDINF